MPILCAGNSTSSGLKIDQMHPLWVDLHVHTVLSPCAELEMGAPDIIERCRQEEIDLIAITDHNSARNAKALIEAGKMAGITVLPGVEVQSREDIHVVCIFPEIERALSFGEWVWGLLPKIPNRPDIFGMQLVIDVQNNIIDEVEILLVQGIEATVDEIIRKGHSMGGLVVLPHLDRPSFSYTAVLGILPEDVEADALELSCRLSGGEAEAWRIKLPNLPIIRSSDAHFLCDIKRKCATPVLADAPTFDELCLALNGERGRAVLWPWALDIDLRI